MATKIRRTAGSVFDALGFPPEEAAQLRIRADLMGKLRQVIEQKEWTQAEAAKRLGVTQPRISDLVRGKIDRFSIDTLIALLGAVGVSVTVTTRRRSRVA